jgi:hypothetical protein
MIMVINESQNQRSPNSRDAQTGLLRDPIWQFVGAILAGIAIILSVILFFVGQPKKELQVLVDTNASLINVSPEAAREVEVLYKGNPVGSAFLIQLHFVNSGNQAILESDFSKNTAIEFDPKLEIVDYAITSSDPENIGLTLTQTAKNRVEISPALLNPGDTVNLRFIVVGEERQASATFNFDARVRDIKQIAVIDASDLPGNNILTTVVNTFLGALVILSSLLSLLLLAAALGTIDSRATVKVSRRGWSILAVSIFVLILSLLLLFRDNLF